MRSKTGKRELAWLFAGVLLYEIFIDHTEMVEIIVWPFVTFIAAAASIHVYGGLHRKQDTFTASGGWGPEGSGQRPGREDK